MDFNASRDISMKLPQFSACPHDGQWSALLICPVVRDAKLDPTGKSDFHTPYSFRYRPPPSTDPGERTVRV